MPETAANTEKVRRFNGRTTAQEVVADIDLNDKTFLITGCTSGIGVETARALVLKGAHVVMANRSVEASEKLRDQLYIETEHRKIDIIKLDLNSLRSVKEAAEKYLENEWALDVLILNAGVFAPNAMSASKTADDFESAFGINHLGHFYLAYLLVHRLRESKTPRVVAVSSLSHSHTGIKSATPTDEKIKTLIPEGDIKDSFYKLYAYSKLCNILFIKKLARMEKDSHINAYALHPGTMIATNIQRSFGLLGRIYTFLSKPFVRTVAQGAATTVYCAASPDVAEDTGKYYDCCWEQHKDYAEKLCDDVELQDALWHKSIEIIEQFEYRFAKEEHMEAHRLADEMAKKSKEEETRAIKAANKITEAKDVAANKEEIKTEAGTGDKSKNKAHETSKSEKKEALGKEAKPENTQ
ncbi:hypothetical protein L596_000240 [Steinernema carpocapsae]|uniref:Uncharacterized protein n=1 Tax=Steinernema carpocapsae TaxID=34508 RepID=A0A4U8UK01_STECR|nr:hypothetical protein L596_000240 [Steinernema carpocapsae]